MVDAEACQVPGRKPVWVRVPPSAPPLAACVEIGIPYLAGTWQASIGRLRLRQKSRGECDPRLFISSATKARGGSRRRRPGASGTRTRQHAAAVFNLTAGSAVTMPEVGVDAVRPRGGDAADRERAEHGRGSMPRPCSTLTAGSAVTMPEERVELSRPCGHGILSPARLPVPPLGLGVQN